MTKTRNSIIEQPGERGSALLGVLLLMMMMSALAAALGVSGRTETLISRNQRSAAQAQAAAEAGLNHAVELVTTYMFEWEANGLVDVEAALDALLLGPDGASGTADFDLDNGSLGPRVGAGIETAEALPLGTQLAIANGIARYEAFVMDDDATAPTSGDYVEDGNLLNDLNNTLIVRATGYAQDNTKVTLEALVVPSPLPAIVVDGDLDISGNPTITGSVGGAHANGDLTISGNPSVAVTPTASGTYTGSHPGYAGAPPISVKPVQASDYRSDADFILTAAGQMTLPDNTVLCDDVPDGDCKDDYGWEFDGDGWKSQDDGDDMPNGTFYVEGKVTISGSLGDDDDPAQISIIAEGSIEISGNPEIEVDTPNLLFVTDGDLKISGSLEMEDDDDPGRILVRGQIQIEGNPKITGWIIVEDADVGALVAENHISGDMTLTYNGEGRGSSSNAADGVAGWRDVRDAN